MSVGVSELGLRRNGAALLRPATFAWLRFIPSSVICNTKRPQHLDLCQKALAIPFKRAEQRSFNYFSLDGMKLLLSMPDASRKSGRPGSGHLLSLKYDTGARGAGNR